MSDPVQLLVIAGPTAAGKSTFMARLRAGDLPDVAARIGFDPRRSWQLASEDDVLALRRSGASPILCHYDILHVMPPDFARNEAPVFEPPAGCRVVTLRVPHAVLIERIIRSEFDGRPPRDTQVSNWDAWTARARVLPHWLQSLLGRHYFRLSLLGKALRRVVGITPPAQIFAALDAYRDAGRVAAIYREWGDLCAAAGVEHMVLDEGELLPR